MIVQQHQLSTNVTDPEVKSNGFGSHTENVEPS